MATQEGSLNPIMNQTHAGITLEDAYVAFDMRESYLQRHASSLGMESEMVELQTKDFSTRSCNVWKSDEMSLYPESGSCGDPDSDAEFDDQEDLQQKVSYQPISDHLRFGL